ncbi:cbb3-type cytochrome c oxidase subunit 3 [Palleronia caenipelagi]|uniref:Cbb3-type cytochrome c oxidase subunit 3 n=1 Tax=Palleronia caenipelagi TaxID=2489174 RepID=A0A547PTB1_9RHOB|nr:cbb3-type cytochrome c oxidase subunit 3 [Palleronia caenipelagi]TRD17368.1 cbb3-type cytochrome c oxidase subunit 3 [Palleronia caenipelagi]
MDDTYSLLRAFADSWALLALMLVFLGVVFWAYRPGSRELHEDAAQSIFRSEDRPARADADRDPTLEAPK